MADQPHRRIRGTLTFEADDWTAVRSIFLSLVHRTREGPIVSIVSGGWNNSHDIKCTEAEGPTGDQYREQLEAYVQTLDRCTCPTECDCQSPDTNPASISSGCPVHNDHC